jgi:hypothetical protein
VIYEVRSYCIDPSVFDEYKTWVDVEARPILEQKLDLVGIWVRNRTEPELDGSQRPDDRRCPDLTWTIRWRDMEHRTIGWQGLAADPTWKPVFEAVPGGQHTYQVVDVFFADEPAGLPDRGNLLDNHPTHKDRQPVEE